jgi:hypothetical protein
MLGMYYEANTNKGGWVYIYISSDQHSTGYGDSWILRLGERERDNIMFNHDVWDMMYWIALLRAVGTKFKDTNVAHGQQDFSTNLIQGPPYMPSDSKFYLSSTHFNWMWQRMFSK